MIAQCSQSVPHKQYSPHVRRIPRGTSTVSDPLPRLMRQATANHKRVRGMKQRVASNEDRMSLEIERQRLVSVIRAILERPEEVNNGSIFTINNAMSEARAIYAQAPKLTKPRNRKRKNNDRDDDQPIAPERYTGEEDTETKVLRPAASTSKSGIRRDAKADEWQDSLYTPPSQAVN